MKLKTATTVQVTGETTNPSVDFRIPLVYGWNQIGNPFESSRPIASLKVEIGSRDPISLEDAWLNGVIGRTIWQSIGATSANLYQAATTMEPWLGYYVNCLSPTGVVLVIPHP